MTRDTLNTKKKESTDKRKKDFINILRANAGNIKQSCIKANIGRSTYYGWIDDDADFFRECKNVNEELIDFAESQLMEHISSGNLTAIIFYLKCKGQSRGYIEKYVERKKSFQENELIVI